MLSGKSLGIILLYDVSYVFWGVDFKSAISFFRPALETPDNPEKN